MTWKIERELRARRIVMTWKIERELIMDVERVVGSVRQQPSFLYRVEIMWSGLGGDIVYVGSQAEAAAFIEGVERAWRAVGIASWPAAPTPGLERF